MMMTPSVVFFLSFIAFSIFLICSSSSWLLCWVGIELNTMTFIPLMFSFKTGREGEAAVKYFLTQTLASVIFLVGVLGLKLHPNFFVFLLVLGLMIKMGVAPFHSWVLGVGEALNWVSLYLMLTLQKINPMILFLSSDYSWDLVVLGAIFSIIWGSIMGLSQTNLRKLVILSSIGHMGWLLIAISLSTSVLLIYFFIYCATLLPVIFLFNLSNIGYLNQLSSFPISGSFMSVLAVSLLSLGGLPPFLGFFPKWMVLSQLISSGGYVLSMILVMMSLLTLFYYLRISYTGFLMTKLVVNHYWTMKSRLGILIFSSVLSLTGFMLVFIY